MEAGVVPVVSSRPMLPIFVGPEAREKEGKRKGGPRERSKENETEREKRDSEKLRSQRDRKRDEARERARKGQRYHEDSSWCPAKAIYW